MVRGAIHFDIRDHPINLYDSPLLALIINPYIGNYKVGRTLVDSGSGLNLLFTSLGLPRKHLLLIKEPFSLEKIDLPVILQEGNNTRSEFPRFEVVDFDSAYNYILGWPFHKKFMVVAQFAYSVLKVPGPKGSITIHGDLKGAVACDIKTIDLIRQYRQSPMDLAEPPAK
jgi:hypothetical protein